MKLKSILAVFLIVGGAGAFAYLYNYKFSKQK